MGENCTIEWRVIDGWPMYRVSSGGDVQSKWGRGGRRRAHGDWRPIIGDIASGYRRVTLYDGEQRRRELVHALVLEAFVGPRPEGAEACHANGNRQDNRVANLRWDTPSANWSDRKLHGRTAATTGSRNARHRLTEVVVLRIRERHALGENQRVLARDYEVSESSISMIVNRRTWRHI
jgi:hypothetical protein